MKPMNPKRTRRLRARAATMHAPEEEFEDYGPEPNMKLSHAFVAVLLLHGVAVGGLYAFNTMKADKASSAKTTRSTESVSSQKQSSIDQGSGNASGSGSGSGPSGEPPASSKAPLIAKVSEAPKAVKAVTESAARQTKPTSTASTAVNTAPRGFLASAKSMIGKTVGASGIGAAGVATSSAQEPATATSPASQASQPSRVAVSSGIPETANTYMVKAGDTLTRIASSLGVAIPELEKVNGMTEKSVLQVGQILKVPTKVMSQAVTDVSAQAGKVVESVQQAPAAVAGAVTSATTALTGVASAAGAAAVAAPTEDQGPTTEYTVVKGDSPYKIAKKFKITPDQLMKANGITDPKKIQIGQMLKIPSSATLSKKAAQ